MPGKSVADWLVLALGGALVSLGCGKVASDAGDAVATSGSAGVGVGGAPDSNGGSSNCPVGLPSAAEIASTPRADTNLELLALRNSTGIIADQAIYDRVVRDVTAIRAADPSVAGIGYFARSDGRRLFLELYKSRFADMQSGAYHDWDCLNQTYVETDLMLTDNEPSPYGTLTLKGNYDLERVGAQYAALPGIQSAASDMGGGDGPTICITRAADVWHYVFDKATGDCLAGCTEHEYHHFTTSMAGEVMSLGELADDEVATYAAAERTARFGFRARREGSGESKFRSRRAIHSSRCERVS
jgi:hypothetical protein